MKDPKCFCEGKHGYADTANERGSPPKFFSATLSPFAGFQRVPLEFDSGSRPSFEPHEQGATGPVRLDEPLDRDFLSLVAPRLKGLVLNNLESASIPVFEKKHQNRAARNFESINRPVRYRRSRRDEDVADVCHNV